MTDIIRKEILENLTTYRFAVLTGLLALLVAISVIVSYGDYRIRMENYNILRPPADDPSKIILPPEPMSIFARGLDANTGRLYQLSSLGIEVESSQQSINRLFSLFTVPDMLFIIKVMLALVAILFSFDAVCGGREAGLLRQILASGVPRRTVLAGKYLGGLASVLIPFTISFLAGMLLLALNPGVQLDGTDFAVFAALLLQSWLYVAVFFGLGLFVSTRARTSAQAILAALFAWIILVLVIPNISPFVAAELSPVPSVTQVNQQVFQIVDRERDAILDSRLRAMIASSYPDLAEVMNIPADALQNRLAADSALRERYGRFTHERDAMIADVNREQWAKAEKINADFQERSDRQESLARMLTSLSPASDFVFIATDLAETGIASDAHWRRQVNEYDDALGRLADARYRRAQEQNPAFSVNDYIDLRDRPRFREVHADLVTRMAPDGVQWGILLVFNVLFFMLALAGFQRYDVR